MTVEEMKRRDAYERSQAVKRIQEETERSRQLLEQRKQLQVGGGAACGQEGGGEAGGCCYRTVHLPAAGHNTSASSATAGPAPPGQHAG